MSKTFFICLPAELIHEIFSYLSSLQILQSFSSINHYLNNIIRNYQFHYLNFSSEQIQKKELDLICQFIPPRQILGLTLGRNRFHLFNEYLIHVDSIQ